MDTKKTHKNQFSIFHDLKKKKKKGIYIYSDGQRQRQCFPYECIITRAGWQTNKSSQEADDCATLAPGVLSILIWHSNQNLEN